MQKTLPQSHVGVHEIQLFQTPKILCVFKFVSKNFQIKNFLLAFCSIAAQHAMRFQCLKFFYDHDHECSIKVKSGQMQISKNMLIQVCQMLLFYSLQILGKNFNCM